MSATPNMFCHSVDSSASSIFSSVVMLQNCNKLIIHTIKISLKKASVETPAPKTTAIRKATLWK